MDNLDQNKLRQNVAVQPIQDIQPIQPIQDIQPVQPDDKRTICIRRGIFRICVSIILIFIILIFYSFSSGFTSRKLSWEL